MIATPPTTVSNIAARLARWFFFSVLFALLPLAFAYVKALSVGPTVGLQELVARGGLLLLAAGLSAGAIGDLLLSDKRWMALKVSAAGFCVSNAVGASLYFVVVSDAYTMSLARRTPLETNLNVGFAFWLSVILYGVAVFTSLVCVWVTALESLSKEQEWNRRQE